MNISNIEYHSKMMADLAKQNGGAFIMMYSDTKVDEKHSIGISTIVGERSKVLSLVLNMVEKAAEEAGVPVELLLVDMFARIRKWKEDEKNA